MKKNILFFSIAALLFTACNNSEQSASTETKNDSSSAAKDSSTVAANTSNQWKIGVQLWTFRLFSFTDAISKVDSAGAKFIEAFPGQQMGGDFGKKAVMGPELSAEDRAKVKELLKSKGITMIAFGVTGGKDAKEWQKLFEFAKDMGLQYITVEPEDKHWGLVDSLAGVYGVKAAIHDHPKPSHYWHPDSVLAAATGHPNIGACADLGHWSRSGLDVVECLKKLEGHIIGAHFKDVKEFGKTDAEDVITGTGVNKWPEIFAEFKRQNFNGMFSIERENNWEHNMTDVKQEIKFFNEQVAALK
ncbi:MAG: sugar phosphate isomerase/epimerase [Chitinophagaceae bacterium]|nr:sugar phosphate isomerase/epimerase [Chitinophagaceae bacterium]